MRRTLLTGAIVGIASVAMNGAAWAQRRDTLKISLALAEEQALSQSPLLAESQSALALAQARAVQVRNSRILPTATLRNIFGVMPRARGEFTEFGVLVSPDTNSGLGDLRPFTDLEINLVQPLYTFGRLSSAVAAAESGVSAAVAGVDAERNSIRLQVRTLFWGLVLGRELEAIVTDAKTEADKAQNTIQTKLDEGSDEVTQTDLFKVQVFLYEIEKRQREAAERIQLAQTAMGGVLGAEQQSVITPSDSIALAPLDFQLDSLSVYQAMARRNRPEMLQLEAGIEARRSLITTNSGELFPQLFIAGQIKLNRAQDRFDARNPFVNNPTNFFRTGVVLGVNWNLNFWQTRDKARISEFEAEALSGRQPAIEAGVMLEVEKAWLAVQVAGRNVAASTVALTATDNWLRSEAQVFDLGLGDVKDFIDAFRANSTMRAEHAENIAKFNIALAELSKAVGRDLYPH